MRYGGFGRTGLTISTVSMGCNRLGDPGVDPAQWPPLVERALELGVTLFDTAISYNQGRSEAMLRSHSARTGRGVVGISNCCVLLFIVVALLLWVVTCSFVTA